MDRADVGVEVSRRLVMLTRYKPKTLRFLDLSLRILVRSAGQASELSERLDSASSWILSLRSLRLVEFSNLGAEIFPPLFWGVRYSIYIYK